MDLNTVQLSQGARLAPDQIPLDFGDQAAEYAAALEAAVLLDRSHEARLALYGASALDIVDRISTNDLSKLSIGAGRPSILTNAHARILDRIVVFKRADHALVLGEPGRARPLAAYLQRNIFFGDDTRIVDLGTVTHGFDLHGPHSGGILAALGVDTARLDVWQSCEAEIGGSAVFVSRRKPVVEQRWSLMVAKEQAAQVWSALVEAGALPAGSMIYNVLRVRAGLGSVGRELSEKYIPLEVGLWDEVSFSKGCYTGQEIIARMESRNRLAKLLVSLRLDAALDAPAAMYNDDRNVGELTSCVTAPDGEIFALAVVKPDYAREGQSLSAGVQHIHAEVKAVAGVQANFS
jgi:folate-binding protein YgfZ